MANKFKISLFYPYVTVSMKQAAYDAMGKKTITQGETVSQFEKKLSLMLGIKNLVALNCCTSALELAYHLLDLKPKDEVITPVFTCSADNLLLLRRGIKVVFADVNENMLLNWDDAEKKITPKTKAIVNVHLFNQLSPSRKQSLPIIGDAAQYLGKTSGELFTCYSFQATKIITTIDGGALVCANKQDYRRAKLLRWYGIDRDTNKDNIEVDIHEPGFKYHMNNITAAIGLAALANLEKFKLQINNLQNHYRMGLNDIPNLKIIGGSPYLIHAEDRDKLKKRLVEVGIESGLGHRRNDLYTVFGGKRLNLPNMNKFENTYLLLPCRANMTIKEVDYICSKIKKFYGKR